MSRAVTHTYKWRFVYIALLFIAVTFACFIKAPVAHADYGDPAAHTGYFKGANLGFGGYLDVLDGGITASSIANFESKILTIHNGSDSRNGQGYAIGADFIIQTMRGGSPTDKARPSAADIAQWQNDLKNPSLTMSSQNYCTSKENSGYKNGDVAWIPFAQCGQALVFKINGNIVYIIREDCGNPFGVVDGLPPYNPSWDVDGYTSTTTPSVYPGQTAHFNNHLHNNGPGTATTAYQLYWNYGGGSPAVAYGGSTGASMASGTDSGNAGMDIGIGLGDPNSQICAWISFSPENQSGGSDESGHVCVAINHPHPICNGMSINPAFPDPHQAFTVATSTNYSNNPDASYAYGTGARSYLRIYGPSPSTALAMPQITDFAGGAPGGGTTIDSTFGIPGLNAGNYWIEYGITNSPIPGVNISCAGLAAPTQLIGYKPHFQVSSGDIKAGTGFCGIDTPDPTAGIKSWNNGSPGFTGAGSQLGAFSLGNLMGFPTGTNSDGSNSGEQSNGSGLAFSNTSANGAIGQYGGQFASLPCASDYAGTAAAKAGAVVAAGASVDIANAANCNKTLVYSAALDVHASAPLGIGCHVKVVVKNSDATVSSDIRYAGYSVVKDIPQFELLVQGGSIHIVNNVGELHGVYDAQPSSTAGTGYIYTCYDPGIAADVTDYATCNHQLTIYGALAAAHVFFERTYGSINADPTTGTPATAAESIQYNPELWLAPSTSGAGGTCTPTCPLDALTSLAPVL